MILNQSIVGDAELQLFGVRRDAIGHGPQFARGNHAAPAFAQGREEILWHGDGGEALARRHSGAKPGHSRGFLEGRVARSTSGEGGTPSLSQTSRALQRTSHVDSSRFKLDAAY